MRTMLLFSAAAVLAACSDNQQPTAPRSASSRGSAAGSVAPATQTVNQPYAKPTDQVGFTSVAQYHTPVTVYVNPGEEKWAVADCPAGSIVVGGGFEIQGIGNHDAPPIVGESRPDGNSWRVALVNYATGAQQAAFRAWALCAS